MKCGYCGCDLLPDSVFCPQCGANVAAQMAAEDPGYGYTANPDPGYAAGPVQNMGRLTPKRKKSPLVLIGAVCVLAVLAAVGFFAVKKIGGGGKKEYQVVYYKDGMLYYTPDVRKESEPVAISEVRFDTDDYDYPNFLLTEDGTYLYFYSRIREDYAGDLCRVKLSGLKKDVSRNEECIEEIDSNVSVYTIFSDSEKAVYRKSSNRLIYLDGNRERDIDSNVNGYLVDQENEKIIYTVGGEAEEFSDLYVYDIKEDQSEKLADGISGYLTDTENQLNTDFLLYTRMNDENLTLYECSVQGKEREVAENVGNTFGYDSEKNAVYYTAGRTETRTLYDYVDDTEAGSDEGASEPKRQDFLTETTEEAAVSSEDYQYYFVENPDESYYFYDYLDFDSDMNMYSYYNDEDYENDRNYLYYYDDLRKQWYSYDIQGYEAASEQYYSRADRMELREELKENVYEQTVSDLYYYVQGETPVLIAENVGDNCVCSAKDQIAVYRKLEQNSIRIPLEDISGVSDLTSKLTDGDIASENVVGDLCCFYDGKEQSLEENMVPQDAKFSEDGSVLAVTSLEGQLLFCDVKKGEITKKDVLDNSGSGAWFKDVYYFIGDEEDGNGDLCKYDGGEKTRLVRNISFSSMSDDGNWLAMSDCENGVGTLALCTDGGESVRISRRADLGSYAYLDQECILYLSENDLYVYTGGSEDRRVDRDVKNYRSMAGYAKVYLY